MSKLMILREIYYLSLLPFIGLYMLFHAVQKSNSKPNRSNILVEVSSFEYLHSHFSLLSEELDSIDVKYAGDGLDFKRIDQGGFQKSDSIRLLLVVWLVFPIVILLSIFYRRNFSSALFRTLFVYYRTASYFHEHPTDIFLTTRDNTCSSAFYSAFKAQGGRYLCAIQNGLRWPAYEGSDYSCFDHLFAISHEATELYIRNGSEIGATDIIAPLQLDLYLGEQNKKKEKNIDILFIDQGYPVPGVDFWGPAVRPDEVHPFFGYIRKFACSHSGLKMVYLLRRYDDEQKIIEKHITEWAKGTEISLYHPDNSLSSYDVLTRSKVVVTMYSTLGVEALALGCTTLFFNVANNADLNICTLPYQHFLVCYEGFEETLIRALAGKIERDDNVIRHFSPPARSGSAKLIAQKVINYLKIIHEN